MTVLGEDVGQHVQAGGLIGADHQRAARTGALIGHGQQRLVPHLQQALGVGEQHPAGGREGHIFTGTIEQAVSVLLLQLADLGADRGLGAKNFLPGAGKTSQLGHFQKRH